MLENLKVRRPEIHAVEMIMNFQNMLVKDPSFKNRISASDAIVLVDSGDE